MRVVVERSGGFAGVVVRGEADTAQLDRTDPGAAQRLRELAGRVDFAALEHAGSSSGGSGGGSSGGRGADRFQYDVEVHDDDGADGGSHRLRLGEAAVPQELRPLLELVLTRR